MPPKKVESKSKYVDFSEEKEVTAPNVEYGVWRVNKFLTETETMTLGKGVSVGVMKVGDKQYEVNMVGEKEVLFFDNIDLAKAKAVELMRQKLLRCIEYLPL